MLNMDGGREGRGVREKKGGQREINQKYEVRNTKFETHLNVRNSKQAGIDSDFGGTW